MSLGLNLFGSLRFSGISFPLGQLHPHPGTRPPKQIFKETNLLSVNQINAQIKLTEVWKSQNTDSYPIEWTKREDVIKRQGLKRQT